MNKLFTLLSVGLTVFLPVHFHISLAQEIDQIQNSSYNVNTDLLTFPLTVVPGFGLVQGLEVILAPDPGSETNGRFTLTQGEPVMLFGTTYHLSTAVQPEYCLSSNFSLPNISFMNSDCAGSGFTGQRWEIVEPSTGNFSRRDDYFWLKNEASNNCLTKGSPTSESFGMGSCDNDDTSQLFRFVSAVGVFFTIEPLAISGVKECMTAGIDDTSMRLAACENSPDQLWMVRELGEVPNFSGYWITTFGPMFLSQEGSSVTGTFSDTTPGTITGTADNTLKTITGTWTQEGSNGGALEFELQINARKFRGNWSPTNEWCGYRDGLTPPDPCLGPFLSP